MHRAILLLIFGLLVENVARVVIVRRSLSVSLWSSERKELTSKVQAAKTMEIAQFSTTLNEF